VNWLMPDQNDIAERAMYLAPSFRETATELQSSDSFGQPGGKIMMA
jgi:hypothetical protein